MGDQEIQNLLDDMSKCWRIKPLYKTKRSQRLCKRKKNIGLIGVVEVKVRQRKFDGIFRIFFRR